MVGELAAAPKEFCHRISEGLDNMSFEERQELLRLVVDRVTVEDGTARIDTIIPGPNDGDKFRTRRGEPVEPPCWGIEFPIGQCTRVPGLKNT